MKLNCCVKLGVMAAAVCCGLAPPVHAQIRLLGVDETSGTIESVAKEEITLKDSAGKIIRAKIQTSDEEGVALTGGIRLRYPATVKVEGRYPKDALKPGTPVVLTARLNRLGAATGKIAEVTLAAADGAAPGVHPESEPAAAKDAVPCKVVGEVMRLTGDRLVVKVPAGEFTKKTALAGLAGPPLLRDAARRDSPASLRGVDRRGPSRDPSRPLLAVRDGGAGIGGRRSWRR
jgi:hypothetical protein